MNFKNLFYKPQKVYAIVRFSIVLLLVNMVVVSTTSFSYAAEYQGIPVSGTVIDNFGEALPGVNIIEKGTLNGVVSDVAGRFTITVSGAASVLQFSFMGFTTQDVIVGDQRLFNITLNEDSQRLDEVVVVGYGTQQKRDITGSVAVVQADELLKSTGSSALQQLQGKASGVHIASTGAAGGRSMVRIRGINTINNNGPLYVIDGVSSTDQDLNSFNSSDIESIQVLKDASSSAIYGSQAANGVVLITTKKGSRSGPVINYSGYYGWQQHGKRYDLVNSEDRMNMDFEMQKNNLIKSGLWDGEDQARPSHRLFTMNAEETGFVAPKYIYQGSEGPNGSENYDPNRNDWPFSIVGEYSDTDWWKEITRVSPIQNHQLSISGGSDKGLYNMSINVHDNQGIVKNYYYKRYSTRLNTSFDVRPWLRVGENLAFTWSRDLGNVNSFTESNIFSWTYRAVPWVPVYDVSGNFAGSRFPDCGNWQNPVAVIEREKDNYWTNTRLIGDLWAEVDIIKGLTFRTQFGITYGTNYYFRMNKENPDYVEYTGDRARIGANSNLEEQGGFSVRWQSTNQLTYKTVINNIHRISVMAATEAIKSGFGRTITAARTGYNFEDDIKTWTLSMGDNNNLRTNSSGWRGEYTMFSVFGRLDYSLMDKYLLTVNARRDGSSRFAEKYRYGFFPSVSVGWRLSEEGFMLGTRSWLDDLKLRAGWGKVGNSEGIGTSNWASTYGMSTNNANYDLRGNNGGSGNIAYRQSRIGGTETRWEAVQSTNVGFDASFLRGKFGVSFEYYVKKTTDMLVEAAFSYLAGDASIPNINFGDMENKGWDASINYRDSRGDFGWDVTLIGYHYKNKVIKLSETDSEGYARWGGGDRLPGQLARTCAGEPISHFFGYKVDGFYENVDQVRALLPIGQSSLSLAAAENWVGRYKFAKTDPEGNQGRLGTSDRVIIGNPHPKLLASLNIGLTYKNFDFTMFWNASYGNDIFNNTKAFTDFVMFKGSYSKLKRDKSWVPGRTDAELPMLNYGDTYSGEQITSYFVEDGSFLRLQNLVLGYTLPRELLRRATISNLRIYGQVENALTFTKYTGLNPEMTHRDMGSSGGDLQRGIDGGGYPVIIRYILGVNITF